MATATKTKSKAKKNAPAKKSKTNPKPTPEKKATKTVGVVDADMRSAKAVVRHGIRSGWSDEKIIATLAEKWPAYIRAPADLRWHRNPKHAADMEVGLPKKSS